jgi:predicted adenylyl cyclase CyaB
MNEIEVKILEIDSKVVHKTLKKYRAKFVKSVFQQNFRYHDARTKKLKIAIRVRKEGKSTILTIKANQRTINGHKVVDEYETPVDYENIIPILEILGFEEFAVTEIKREYWRIHNCSVEFCIVPQIPEYLEIEGASKDIDYVAKMLGYSRKDYVVDELRKHYPIKTKYLRF